MTTKAAPTVRNEEDVDQRDLSAIVDLALTVGQPELLENGAVYAVAVPAGGSVAVIDRDLDEYRDRPRRNKGTLTVRDGASLVTLVERLADPNDVLVYADPVTRQVTAVLNDVVDARNPGWRDHKVVLTLVETPAWKRWTALDGKFSRQAAFAEHIEACQGDIAEPAAADLLEIVQTLEGSVNAEFRNAVRLDSGARQFVWAETTDARAGKGGELTIPGEFILGLTPWQGEFTPFRVTARLRYRAGAEGLTLGFVLVDLDRILDTAFTTDVITPLQEAGMTVVLGTP